MIKYTFTLVLLFCFSFLTTQAQTVSTWVAPNITDDMIFDDEGNIFGSDFSNGRIYKVEPNGTVTEFATGFSTCNGLAFDDDGNLFVVDFTAGSITEIDPLGNKTSLITGLSQPSGLIRVPNTDTMVYTRYGANRISKISMTDGGTASFIIGQGLDGPVGLHYTDDGDLLVANYNNSKVFRVEDDNTLTQITHIPINPQAVGFIEILDDHIYSTFINGHKLYRSNFDGEYVLIAGSTTGSTDGDVSVAKFSSPNGILKSLGGDSLFISDFGGTGIRVITGLDPFVGVESLIPAIVQDIQVYPNPAAEEVHFEFSLYESLDEIQIQIADLSGRIVQVENWSQRFLVGNQMLSFQLSRSLISGQYLYQIKDESRLLAGGNIQIQ